MAKRRELAGKAKVVPLMRDSHVPMHRQLSRQLREAIAKGVYRPGDRIPTEPELVQRFGVSRITARQAVERLAREGLVVRKQGKGTFVSGPLVHHDLHELRGIYDELVEQGLNPETEILEFRQTVAPPRIAERLQSGERKLIHWRRLYRLNGRPFGVSSVHLDPGGSEIDRDTVARLPTYSILESVLKLCVDRADVRIRYEHGNAAISRVLGLRRGAPLMVLERVSYSPDGIAREHTIYYAKAESYEFSLRVRGKLPLAASLKQAS